MRALLVIGFVSFKVVVLMCFLCDIEFVSGPRFNLTFFSYFPDSFVTYLNSCVRCVMKVSKLWSTMVDVLNNMVQLIT